MHVHGIQYLPDITADATLARQRLEDAIVSPLGGGATPRQVLDVTGVYTMMSFLELIGQWLKDAVAILKAHPIGPVRLLETSLVEV